MNSPIASPALTHRDAFEAHLRSQGFEPRRNADGYHGNNGHDWLTWKAALAQLGTGSGAGAQSDSGADSGHATRAVPCLHPSVSEALSYKPVGWIVRDNVCDEYYRVEGAARSYAEIIGATVITVFERTAPTSAAGATKPDDLTSSPEPAPALRAAEWVEEAMRLAERIEAAGARRGREGKAPSDHEPEMNALRAHLSPASGLLPVAREGLSDKQIDALAYRFMGRDAFDHRAFARAIQQASGDAPGEAK